MQENQQVSDQNGMKRQILLYTPLPLLILLDLIEDGQLTGTFLGIPYGHYPNIALATKISIGQWIRIKRKGNKMPDMKETLRQKQVNEHHHRKE